MRIAALSALLLAQTAFAQPLPSAEVVGNAFGFPVVESKEGSKWFGAVYGAIAKTLDATDAEAERRSKLMNAYIASHPEELGAEAIRAFTVVGHPNIEIEIMMGKPGAFWQSGSKAKDLADVNAMAQAGRDSLNRAAPSKRAAIQQEIDATVVPSIPLSIGRSGYAEARIGGVGGMACFEGWDHDFMLTITRIPIAGSKANDPFWQSLAQTLALRLSKAVVAIDAAMQAAGIDAKP